MAFKVSTGLRNYLLDTGAFKTAMDLGFLKIYKGTVPATADDSIGSATELVELSVDGLGTGVTFDSPAAGGIISKAAAESWQGVNSDAGTATFFRFVQPGDLADLDATAIRIQGAVAVVGGELNLSNVGLTFGATQTVNHFNVALPTL